MKDQNQIFQLFGETSGSIFPLAREVMGPLFEEYFTELRFYQPVFIAYQLSPKILTEPLYRKRKPYSNSAAISENLKDAAAAGYLEVDPSGGYQISQKGRQAIDIVHERFYEFINGVNQFPRAKLKLLADLLKKLVESAAKAEFSSGIFSLELVRGGHPKVEPGTLAEVDQLLDDLNAFRDDAHIAAWIPYGVSGHVWEVLTFVWNGEAKTAQDLVEKMPYRSFLEGEYQEALDTLVGLGWIEEGREGYQAAPEGISVREAAEEQTDLNYFGPWSVFTPKELAELRSLLEELKKTNLELTQQD